MSKLKSKFVLTVSESLWEDMAKATYPEFADSYLTGATQTATSLVPHTVTAFQKLHRHRQAREVLEIHKLKLIEPLPFGHSGRPDGPAQSMAAE